MKRKLPEDWSEMPKKMMNGNKYRTIGLQVGIVVLNFVITISNVIPVSLLGSIIVPRYAVIESRSKV
ncbi:MAG: hypothetical protein ACI9V1_001240 [Spirosomataceae bacterium]|jgi:hypothetical protein